MITGNDIAAAREQLKSLMKKDEYAKHAENQAVMDILFAKILNSRENGYEQVQIHNSQNPA